MFGIYTKVRRMGSALIALVPLVAQLAKDQKEGFKAVMDALTILQGKVAGLNTSVTNEITAVQTFAASVKQPDGSISAADAAKLGDSLDQIKATLDAETTILTASIPATPVTDPPADPGTGAAAS